MIEAYSINALSEMLERDRRTITRALREVEPDGHDAQGTPRWKIATAVRALSDRGASDSPNAAISEIERAAADVEDLLEQLRAADGVEAVRKLLRTGLGKAIGALDRALEAGQQGRRPAEQQLLVLVHDQIIGSVVDEILVLAGYDDATLNGPPPASETPP
jgi:hypothetical protein